MAAKSVSWLRNWASGRRLNADGPSQPWQPSLRLCGRQAHFPACWTGFSGADRFHARSVTGNIEMRNFVQP